MGRFPILRVVGPGLRCLLIKRLAVRNASTHELWPRRDRDVWLDLFWQSPPEVRMMPAQVVSRAVAVAAYGGAELDHLSDQLFSRHAVEIVIHEISLLHLANPRDDVESCQLAIANRHVVVLEQGHAPVDVLAARGGSPLTPNARAHRDLSVGNGSPNAVATGLLARRDSIEPAGVGLLSGSAVVPIPAIGR